MLVKTVYKKTTDRGHKRWLVTDYKFLGILVYRSKVELVFA